MQTEKLTNWSAWNHPRRPKLLSPLAGAAGVGCAHLLMLFYFNVDRSGVEGMATYALAAGAGFLAFWLASVVVLALAD